MAVEIIPKPKIKKRLEISLIGVAYYGVIVLLFAALIGYGFSFLFEKNMSAQLGEFTALILEKYNPETQALEREILDFNEKLTVFKSAFGSFRKPSKFFGFLSPICHEKVFFSKTGLDVDKSAVQLQGNTESFKTLKEQMMIFGEQETISDIDLAKISILDEGGISFDVSLFLAPKIFK